jgi:hypothetical protein
MRSSHWAFNLVSNFAYGQWDAVYPVVQQKIVEKEAKYMQDVIEMDETAAAMLEKEGAASTVKALTDFTVRTGDGLVDDWNAFFGELFMRFSDGFSATAIPRKPMPPGAHTDPGGYVRGGTDTVAVDDMPYDDKWYARIAADCGQRCDIPAGDLIDPRLSRERLQYINVNTGV